MEVADTVKVELYDISWRKENDVYIIWKKGGATFVELSESSFAAYNLLKQAKPLTEVSEILAARYGEHYNLKEFVSELIQLGFVRFIDGIPLPSQAVKGSAFAFIKPRHVQWLYSKPLLSLYLGLLLFAGVILIFNPSHLPSYQDYFFHDSYLVVLIVSITTGFALLFLHEFAHLIAGKAAGVDGYFGLSMRLFFPVAETNLTQLWRVPRNKRYIPFLAGMLNDALLVAIILISFWISDQLLLIETDGLHAFAKLVALLLYYSMTWQFLLFMRTDIYYVIAHLLGCRNLYGDSWNLVLNAVRTLFKRRRKDYQIPPRELKIVKLYAPFMLVATLLSISVFAFWGLPILVQMFAAAINMVLLGYRSSPSLFLEGAILSGLLAIQIIGFLFFLTRSLFRLRSRLTKAPE